MKHLLCAAIISLSTLMVLPVQAADVCKNHLAIYHGTSQEAVESSLNAEMAEFRSLAEQALSLRAETIKVGKAIKKKLDQGKPVLISLGSMCLYAYEPETGKELWRAESPGSHSGAARPVSGHGLVFSPIGYTAEIWAVRPDGSGVVTNSHVAWRYERATARRSSPILVGDWLFDAGGDGVAPCPGSGVSGLVGEFGPGASGLV